MSQYLPPIRINEMFNVSDFNYQYDFISYFIGDNRYVKKNDLKIIVGPTGYTGRTGSTGYTRSTGSTGSTGYTGYTGHQGTAETNGTNGSNGSNGTNGTNGSSVGEILGSVWLVASIANAVASTAIFVSLRSGIAANIAYILSNNIQVTILQSKTQFQTFALDLSENRNSTLFNSNIKVTEILLGDNGSNEIVTLNVTKASKFKKGIDVDGNILNNGTLTQNGISIFNNEVNFVEYTKNPNTETAEIIIPTLNINTLKPGNKILLYNKGYDVNSNPYVCGIGIKQDSSSTTAAYMDYYCNSLGVKSGHRFYAASSNTRH